MAKFRKKIVRPGTPTVGRLDGTEEKDAITPSRLKSWVENTKKLRDLGVLIPAPLAHQDKNKRFAFPVIKAKDGETLADVYSGSTPATPPAWDLANLNAGFWEEFEIDPSDNSLVGVVNVENPDKEKMIGTDVKETSVLVMPGRTVTDANGVDHQIGEHLAHVAICLHAQEKGQANFEPLNPMPAGMAMALIVPSIAMDDVTGLPDANKPKDEKLYKVITLLRSSLNVALPEDTTRENFLESLTLVLTQKLADQQEKDQQEEVTDRPNDASTKTPSIAMSETTQKTESQAPKQDAASAILMNMLLKDKRKALKDRVQKLIETGRVGKSYAEKTLLPKIEAFSMSATDLTAAGDFPKTAVEELIEGLEEAIPMVGESLVEQGISYDIPLDAEKQVPPQDVISGSAIADLSADQADEILDSTFGTL